MEAVGSGDVALAGGEVYTVLLAQLEQLQFVEASRLTIEAFILGW